MGCDIHMFLEYKCGNGMPWQADEHHTVEWEDRCKDSYPKDRKKWCQHCINDRGDDQDKCMNGYKNFERVRATERNYNLFTRMANVRGDGGLEPKGLPADLSEMIQAAADRWDSDGHSHSWLSIEEFETILFKDGEYNRTDRNDAFQKRNYKDKEWWEKRPPAYTTIINYAKNLKEEKSIDKQILGNEVTSEVQVRLVFWFDN